MIYDLSQRRATMFERSLHPALVVHNITAEVIIRLIRAASWIYKFARMAMLATFCIKIFIADSASYNLKAIAWEQEFAKDRPHELTCKFMCAIHHLYRCRQPMLAWFDVIDPLFCLFRLWQLGSNKRHMRARIKKYVMESLRRLVGQPSVEASNFSAWMILMFKYALIADAGADGHGFADESSDIPTLFSTLDELVRLLNGDWFLSGVLIHHCAGCCVDDEHCAEKITECLLQLFVNRSVPVPSFKSWTNAFTALTYVMVFLCCHDLIVHCGPHVKDGDHTTVGNSRESDQWHAKQRSRKAKIVGTGVGGRVSVRGIVRGSGRQTVA